MAASVSWIFHQVARKIIVIRLFMTIEYFPLPSDNGPTQPFVSISMIPAGYLSLPDFLVYTDAAEMVLQRG